MTDETAMALARIAIHVAEKSPYTADGCLYCMASLSVGRHSGRIRVHQTGCVYILALSLYPRLPVPEPDLPLAAKP